MAEITRDEILALADNHQKWAEIGPSVTDAVIAKALRQYVDCVGDVGWLYHNEDAGLEFSRQHPIESGEVIDATEVRMATAAELQPLLGEAWAELGRLRAAGTFSDGIEEAARWHDGCATIYDRGAEDLADQDLDATVWRGHAANHRAMAAAIRALQPRKVAS